LARYGAAWLGKAGPGVAGLAQLSLARAKAGKT